MVDDNTVASILTNLPVSPDPKGFIGLKCFKLNGSPPSRICKSYTTLANWRDKREKRSFKKYNLNDVANKQEEDAYTESIIPFG